MGYVYFIETESDPVYYKVGYTSSHPQKRLKSLQTGNPHRLRLCGVVPNATALLEKEIHGRLKEYSTHGEWFSAPKDEISKILQEHGGDMQTTEYIEVVLDSGVRYLLRLSDLEIFFDPSPLTKFQQTVYFATGESLFSHYHTDWWVNLRELEKDYPDQKEHWDKIRRIVSWPYRSRCCGRCGSENTKWIDIADSGMGGTLKCNECGNSWSALMGCKNGMAQTE